VGKGAQRRAHHAATQEQSLGTLALCPPYDSRKHAASIEQARRVDDHSAALSRRPGLGQHPPYGAGFPWLDPDQDAPRFRGNPDSTSV